MERELAARSTWPAMLLTWTSGFVDLVGYTALLHVFTANMTGNTVHLGDSIARGDFAELLKSAVAIAAFMAGLLASRIAVDIARRIGFRRIAGAIFTCEAMLLAAYGVFGTPRLAYPLMLILVAGAMGLQNATMTHFGRFSLRTTHVTGTLSELADAIAQTIIARDARTRRSQIREAVRLGSAWCFYLAGAAIAAIAFRRWKLACIAAPVAALLFLVVFDSVRPLIFLEPARSA